jgi:hypothetical protein
LPIIATARDAPVITPSAALIRESTHFAWVSSERILPRKLLTSELVPGNETGGVMRVPLL